MIRLFTPAPLQAENPIEASEKQMHYLCHVMRLTHKDIILLFNGKDGTWTAEINVIGKKRCTFIPLRQIEPQQTRATCILCPALIKKENMDLVLQKATELGATAIYPLITERTVVRTLNTERARHIIYEACEQCERNDIPHLYEPQTLPTFLNTLPTEISLIHLAERATAGTTLSPTLKPAFLIGPEGGFTETENKRIANRSDTYIVHLGSTILRAETASLAILSAWQFRLF